MPGKQSDVLQAEEKFALLILLRHARRQTEAYFDTIEHAALLAVNQVQDKRLEFIEKGPNVTASDMLIDILFATALEGALLGLAVKSAANGIMQRVHSTRAAFISLEQKSLLATEAINRILQHPDIIGIHGSKAMASWGAEKAVESFLRSNPLSRLYANEVIESVDRGAMIIHAVVKETAKGIKKNSGALTVKALSPVASAGTALLDSALTFATRQRTDALRVLDELELSVLLDEIPRSEFPGLLEDFSRYTRPLYRNYSLGEIKRDFAEFFELAIWTTMYPMRIDFKVAFEPRIVLSGDKGKDAALTDYLLRRMHVPEVWLTDHVQDSPSTMTFHEWIGMREQHSAVQGSHRTPVIARLCEYLVSVRKGIEQVLAKAPAAVPHLTTGSTS